MIMSVHASIRPIELIERQKGRSNFSQDSERLLLTISTFAADLLIRLRQRQCMPLWRFINNVLACVGEDLVFSESFL